MSKYMQLTTKMRPYYTRGLSKAYPRIANRLHFLDAACSDALNGIRLLQGKCRAARKLSIHFGTEPPEIKGNEIPVWLRDGWGENESTVLADARAAGTDSPVSYMCMFPKPVLMTLKRRSQNTRVNSAAEISLDRLFPNFQDADDDRWHSVINRAKSGSEAALQAVDWNDAPEKHPVCSAVISEIGSGKKGKDIRDAFESTTYGWPRDAIDAAFITMFTTGHIRVTHKGVQLKQGQLDQAKISVSDFRVETVTIDARARIKLRKQFQSAGIPCKPNEESSAAGQFLALAQNDNWNMISLEQQEDILDTEGIAEIPPLSIGDGSSLISTLEETPLTAWKTKIDALPQQFSNAAFAAAMLLEPKTQNIKLSSGTLKTERDVTNWIERTEQELLAKLEDGPIVIS